MAFKGHLSIMFESTTNFRESNFKNRAAPRFLKGKHPLETADLENSDQFLSQKPEKCLSFSTVL